MWALYCVATLESIIEEAGIQPCHYEMFVENVVHTSVCKLYSIKICFCLPPAGAHCSCASKILTTRTSLVLH